jgi:cytochrome c
MKKLLFIIIGSICATAPTFADEKLAKELQCLNCHSVDTDKIGPSFMKIKSYWKGRENYETLLIATIRKGTVDGGSGQHWGNVKMPDTWERAVVDENEAKKLVAWIMGL